MTDSKYLDEAARLAGWFHFEQAERNSIYAASSIRAHAATLEQAAKFRQEVSGAVRAYNDNWRNGTPSRDVFLAQFGSFIIPTSDPIKPRVTVPDDQTPLDDDLSHRFLDVIREGQEARDSGANSPYHGHSLEHRLHATGWVQRDLRIALDRAMLIAHDPVATALEEAMSVVMCGIEGEDCTKSAKCLVEELARRGVKLVEVG